MKSEAPSEKSSGGRSSKLMEANMQGLDVTPVGRAGNRHIFDTGRRKTMRKLVIDRSQWARKSAERKQLNGDSYLLNTDGGMCCLGFYCVQLCGLSEADILRQPNPSEVGITELVD